MTSIGGFPRVLQITAQLPLALVASVCALVKEADFKITLNINQPPATLAQLFPEFLMDGHITSASNAISFQCHERKDSVVSILTAKSSQRYRLQADTLSTLSLFASQLVERLKKHFAKTKHFVCSYTSSLPMHELFTKLDAHFNNRINYKKLQDELGLRATQYRAIQRRLLTKFKDKTPSPISDLGTLLATTHGLILETADQLEQSMEGLQQASCQLICTCQLIILLLKMMDTASSEDFSDLEAALSSSVHHFHEQGWEEVTDAALAFLLRTSLAKSHKEKQRVTNSTVESMKDTTKFKKHISSAIDRLSKSTNILERKEGTGDFSNVSHSSHPPKIVSPIPEGVEVPTTDASNDMEITIPISSRFTERKASGIPRGRSALLHDHRDKILESTSEYNLKSVSYFNISICLVNRIRIQTNNYEQPASVAVWSNVLLSH
uniref:PTHB1 C-terminal domain-containing protein n=1 Tax=Timema tahoe TaxID=61484 RepID=A0A7R9ISG7_9NEOP|nr:unnamed protein product [Timema tahoe]